MIMSFYFAPTGRKWENKSMNNHLQLRLYEKHLSTNVHSDPIQIWNRLKALLESVKLSVRLLNIKNFHFYLAVCLFMLLELVNEYLVKHQQLRWHHQRVQRSYYHLFMWVFSMTEVSFQKRRTSTSPCGADCLRVSHFKDWATPMSCRFRMWWPGVKTYLVISSWS